MPDSTIKSPSTILDFIPLGAVKMQSYEYVPGVKAEVAVELINKISVPKAPPSVIPLEDVNVMSIELLERFLTTKSAVYPVKSITAPVKSS